jgi:hypothetical protein
MCWLNYGASVTWVHTKRCKKGEPALYVLISNSPRHCVMRAHGQITEWIKAPEGTQNCYQWLL